jgi:hypothetical protein
MSEPDGFICEGCGYTIYQFGEASPGPKCYTCKFLDEYILDPRVRGEMRALLGNQDRPHTEAYFCAALLYKNPDYPERRCDFCDTPYQGPAVYCSLFCATQDAH